MTKAHENAPGNRQATIDKLGLRVESRFIPFSQSRNKGEKSPSLNWQVTLYHGDVAVIVTDYSAGSAYAPSYRQPGFGKRTIADQEREMMIAWECETGGTARHVNHDGRLSRVIGSTQDIVKPDAIDVVHSLIIDAEVIDSGGFESWASDNSYDVDSRKAEAIYRACLDIALQLRRAIGDEGLTALRNAFEGY